MDLAHAEVVEQLHHLRPLAERHAALEVEGDGELALRLGALDVLRIVDRDEALRPRPQLGAKARDHRHDLRKRIHVHADVDRHEVDARRPMALERADIGIGVQGQAGMAVPDQRLAVQGRGPELQIVHRVLSAWSLPSCAPAPDHYRAQGRPPSAFASASRRRAARGAARRR